MALLMSYNAQNFDVLIGIDVSARTYSVNTRTHHTMNKTLTMPAKPEYLGNYIAKMYNNKRVICAYEAGPTGFGLYDHLSKRGVSCILISPSSLPKPANARVKTNRIDAEMIGKFLKNGDAKPIRVPDDAYRGLRELVRARETYARARKISKQRIKSLLLAQSLHHDMKDSDTSWSGRYIDQLNKLECADAVRRRLSFLLEDLIYARAQNAKVLKELRAYCALHHDIQRFIGYLSSIPGIAFITASSILGNIGDPSLLRNPRELGGFIGLVPTESSTGDDTRRGSITHLGNAALRSLLIEAAWTTIRHDTRLGQFYHRIRLRHPPGADSQKAIVAVARKLTMIIYRVLKDERDYIPY